MLLHEYLLRQGRERPDAIALMCGDATMTYGDLSQKAAAFAAFLASKGILKGDRVSLYLENSVEAVISIFGTLLAGGCIVPVGVVTPPDHLGQLLRHSGAKVIVASWKRQGRVREALKSRGLSPMLVWSDNAECAKDEARLEDVVEGRAGATHILPRVIDLDLAAIIYTSGTTGKPKGVTHTHQSINTGVESIIEYLENNADDVILSILQLNFSYGLLQLLATFRTGARFVLEKGFGYPYEVVQKFLQHKVTGFAGSPTIWAILLQMEGLRPSDFASVRYITNAAAAIPEPFVARLAALFTNAKIFLMHGLTECLRTAYLPPSEALIRPTSVGKAMRNVELWLEDDHGKRLGPGLVGELVVRSSTMMRGYWDDPEGTARVLMPGTLPWERCLHTGDLFRCDEEGNFYFVARGDEIIKSRGEKVSPVEVESILYTIPGVAECRVFGIPDDILGNRIRAEIVLKDGAILDEATVKRTCVDMLEQYKVPHDVEFVQQLPKTEGGKIKRRSS